MNLTNFSLTDVTPDSTVGRLARILAERIDPNDEYDCEVSITITENNAIESHPASEIPTRGYEYLYADYGVKITVEFVDNAECPSRKIQDLVREYSESLNREHEISYRASFDGGEGQFNALAFPVHDSEFTCGVTDPSWA